MIEYQITDWIKTTLSYHDTSLPRILLRVAIFPLLTIFLLYFVHDWVLKLEFPVIGHTLLGTALGLLLVFRNNASYDRFWEGRKRWGGIVNSSRNLARCIYSYGGDVQHFTPLICCFCHALKHQLRFAPQKDIDQAIEPFITAELKAKLLRHHNVSWMITVEMSDYLQKATQEGKFTWEQAQRIETLVTSLIDHQGACERILKTPVPFSHTVHVRQLLLFYLISLPFVLIPIMGWLSIISMTIIGVGLLGIEEAGIEIEDPFGTDPNDLPLDGICDTICKDVQLFASMNESDHVHK